MPRLQFTMLSLLVAFAVFAAGLTVFIEGARQVMAPRSSAADMMGWCLLAAGIALITAAVNLPFARPSVVLAISMLVTLGTFLAPFVLIWIWILGASLWQAVFG